MRHSYLEKRQPAENIARFYRMTVLPNLFGEWTLCREWGRIGKHGQTRLDWFATEMQALNALTAIETAKSRRGYQKEPVQLVRFDGCQNPPQTA